MQAAGNNETVLPAVFLDRQADFRFLGYSLAIAWRGGGTMASENHYCSLSLKQHLPL
jgi:hypothetical protein